MTRRIFFVPGERYGRLTVIGENGRTPHGQVRVDCRCECGNEINTRGYSLRQGRTLSCGCLQRERTSGAATTHGHTSGGRLSPTYLTWTAMLARCHNHRAENYERYGGAGVEVCPRWQSFHLFLADMGERPEGKTLDRINSDGNYEPNNCRWATPSEQARNRKRRKAARERMQNAFENMLG